ncbi:MAG: hypothetical protein LBP94_06430, partial [Zoogloeaceae bacterium]|nr:hypothetical protein [Zoogloeaceae bacterium]
MANYLIVCVESAKNEKIEHWFSLMNESSTDLLKISTYGETTCYYLANHGKKDEVVHGGVFKGYAIDHERSKIIYSGGNTTVPNVHWPMPGCYIRLQQEFDDVVVGNDLFAQLSMLYFAENG